MWPQFSHFSSTCDAAENRGCRAGTGSQLQYNRRTASCRHAARMLEQPTHNGEEGRKDRARTTGSALSCSSSSALTTSARLALSADGNADGFEYVLTPRFSYAEQAAVRAGGGRPAARRGQTWRLRQTEHTEDSEYAHWAGSS
jgi:hypothetical protein